LGCHNTFESPDTAFGGIRRGTDYMGWFSTVVLFVLCCNEQQPVGGLGNYRLFLRADTLADMVNTGFMRTPFCVYADLGYSLGAFDKAWKMQWMDGW
jgi:hypothetical protein